MNPNSKWLPVPVSGRYVHPNAYKDSVLLELPPDCEYGPGWLTWVPSKLLRRRTDYSFELVITPEMSFTIFQKQPKPQELAVSDKKITISGENLAKSYE